MGQNIALILKPKVFDDPDLIFKDTKEGPEIREYTAVRLES